MTLRIPNVAEGAFLDLILSENMTLKLFTNDVESGLTEAQKEALTAGSFTEATFTGYSSKSLTGGSWTTTPADDFSFSNYAQQTFTRTSTGVAQVIRGYYVIRTTGGSLRWYEYFPGPITVTNNGDTIQITPTFTLDDTQEAAVNARGIIARQILSTNSSTFTTDATTDFVLNNVPVDSSRLYAINLHALGNLSNTGDWSIDVYADGVLLDQLTRLDSDDGAVNHTLMIQARLLWEPATGTPDLDIRVDELSGTGDLAFFGTGTLRRQFWVEDVGPR